MKRENMPTPANADAAVGQEIRRHRRQAGLTLAEVAARIGVTGAQLHRYETGSSRISTTRLFAIAAALEVRAETLLAATSKVDTKSLPTPASSSQEIVELLQMFGSIADPQHRTALVTMARMMSSAFQQPAPNDGVAGAEQAGDDMLKARGSMLAA
jgi:transcriptional regulator with XRE-family HTH domain